MRLIDADELKRKYEDQMWDEYFPYNILKVSDIVNQTLNFINDAPTVERPHGEWVINPNGLRIGKVTHYAVVCSLCKWSTLFADNFCPNCGASMVKEGD